MFLNAFFCSFQMMLPHHIIEILFSHLLGLSIAIEWTRNYHGNHMYIREIFFFFFALLSDFNSMIQSIFFCSLDYWWKESMLYEKKITLKKKKKTRFNTLDEHLLWVAFSLYSVICTPCEYSNQVSAFMFTETHIQKYKKEESIYTCGKWVFNKLCFVFSRIPASTHTLSVFDK